MAQRDEIMTESNDTEYKILFGNVDGLDTSKFYKLRELSKSEDLLILNETNLKEDSTNIFSKYGFGNYSCIKAVDYVTFDKHGDKTKPTKKVNGKSVDCTKRSGFGTAIMTNDDRNITLSKTKGDNELVYGIITMGSLKGLIIGGYRSPSSKNNNDIVEFYLAIQNIIVSQLHANSELDFIIFVGDDNASLSSTSASSRVAATKAEIIFSKFKMIDMLPNISTRGTNQPDSCFAFYNPETLDISVSTIGKLIGDHELIQIDIKAQGIKPIKPRYKRLTKRIKVWEDEYHHKIIDYYLQKWITRWKPEIKENMTVRKINKAAAGLQDSLNKAYGRCFKKKCVFVPENARRQDSAFNLEIISLRAKLQTQCLRIKQCPQDLELRKQFEITKRKLGDVIDRAAIQMFEKAIENQSEAAYNDWKKFYEITGSFINKTSFQTKCDKESSESDLRSKLDLIDQTFINTDSECVTNLDSWKSITPQNRLRINYDIDFISGKIKEIKKVDRFYKNESTQLAIACSLLLKMISLNDYFPKCLRKAKCTFIGVPPKDRAIFSMDFLPKLAESVIKDAIDVIKTEDGTMQCAYTAKRGTTSCNAKGLQEVELSKEPVLQTQQDLVKAFNSVCRKTIVDEAQRLYGAGKLFQSWFEESEYVFISKFGEWWRGQLANQGVMPGRVLGVEAFMMFIATCTGLTGKNKELLWAALYADDTGPLFAASKMQAIKDSFKWVEGWCDKQGVKFHLTGDKKPVYLAYLKKGHMFSEEFDTLELCDTPVVRTDSVKSLGMTWKVRPIDNKGMAYGMMIDKYGYECQWDIGRVKMFAYRVQRIKHTISSEYMKLMLQYFLVSYLQFSAAIIWPRSSEKHRKQIRYYYSMAMAACLGLSAAEALNLACCNP